MSTIGRNDSCPCGSGKKYKHCCGRTDIRTPADVYDRLRRLDGEATTHILHLISHRYPGEIAATAWADFCGVADRTFSDSEPEVEFFERWFLYDWFTDTDDGPAEALLEERNPGIDADIFRLVECTTRSPYSFYQILEPEPGVSIHARDILRNRSCRIMERAASRTARSGDIIYARVVDMDGVSFMMGTGAHTIPSVYLATIVEARERFLREAGSKDTTLSDVLLLVLEPALRPMYFELVDAAYERAHDIRNSDGDPLLFHTLRFEVSSFERAFQAIRALQPEATDEELMSKKMPGDKPGTSSAIVHWSKRVKKSASRDTVQAVFRMTDRVLTVDANSARRAAKAKREVEKRLGKDAIYLGTEIQSVEGALKTSGKGDRDKESRKRRAEQERLMESPEAQAMLRTMMDDHWASWPDTPVPALRGMTPRQAAKDRIGRELLESLLRDFDERNKHLHETFNQVDTKKLRRELGM